VATEIRALIDEGAERLARVCERPRAEASMLLGHAIGRPLAYLIAHGDEQLRDCDATDRYESELTRRANGEPMAYILGEKEFWSLPIGVGPEVLIPRPETELLVERALQRLPADRASQVLDLATGSGAIAIAIAHERPGSEIVATDAAREAVRRAEQNARHNRIGNVGFRAGHWYEPVRGQFFTLITCNPPYIASGDPRVGHSVRRFEPGEALFAGPSGLEALREVIAGAPRHLQSEGWLLVEHGDRQGADVRALFASADFGAITTCRDLAGLERCTEGRLPPDHVPDR
jgi:release factor glutamine methyltransferase